MDKRITKEWNKIKDYNIFKDIDEFALLFIEKPYGICMRKYTSYPWCKENFFFGSYDELKEWYLTTDEIPFYVKEVVGQKFAKLTVLDFLYKNNSKGIRTLHAKCKCNCGNTVEVDYRSLKHGDILGCGCRTSGKESKISRPLTEELLEYWDFDKNSGIDPYKISQMSTQKYWWKDKEGNSYLLSPYVFAKEDKTSSSFPEQALFYYIKKEYSSAINRANFITSDGEILEIDIYIPAYNIGIEYDGVYWHSDKSESDTYKSKVLYENGVKLIRIRENGLPELKTDDFIIEQNPYNETAEEGLIETINQVLNIINTITNITGRETISYEDFVLNRNSIYALIYSKPVDRNIKNTCIGRFWDKERNGDLKPECVSINSNIPIFFKCVAGYSLRILAKTYNYKIDKAKNDNYKLFDCPSDYPLSKCEDNQCCPFANLNMCQGGINCVYQSETNYPKILCLDTSVSLTHRLNSKQQDFLRFCFINKSTFELEAGGGTQAILINKNMSRVGNMGFSFKSFPEKFSPQGRYFFDLHITNEIRENIPNSDLIVYKKLFRPIVGNKGWFFFSLIILRFDESGNIKKHKSILLSKNDGEKITSYSNSLADVRLFIDKVVSD